MIAKLGVTSDAALARALDVAPPTISKIRNRRAPISDGLLIRMHEETGLTIKELKAALGTRPAPRAFFPAPTLRETLGQQYAAV